MHRDARVPAGEEISLHGRMVGCDAAVGQIDRIGDFRRIERRGERLELHAGDTPRSNVMTPMDPQAVVELVRRLRGFGDQEVTPSREHDVATQAGGQLDPAAIRQGEQRRPFVRGKSSANHRAVAAGRTSLKITRIENQHVALTAACEVVRDREPLNARADHHDRRPIGQVHAVQWSSSNPSSPAACSTVSPRRGGRWVGRSRSMRPPVFRRMTARRSSQHGNP